MPVSECAANLGAKSTNKLTWPITEENIVEKYLNESDVEIDMINLPLRPSTQPNTGLQIDLHKNFIEK